MVSGETPQPRMGRPLLYFAALTLALLAAAIAHPARAAAKQQIFSVSLGVIRAELTARTVDEYGRPVLVLNHLRILRSGRSAFEGKLPEQESTDYQPAATGADLLQIRKLDPGDEPSVIVQVYTGGAHCCTRTALYWFDKPARRYRVLERDWGNGGYALKKLGAHDAAPEFVTSDQAFAYAFASYAGSGTPLQVYRFRRGAFDAVTRCYPKLIATQAQEFWQSATQQKSVAYGEPNGVLAPYIADEYQLGRGPRVWRRLDQFPSANAGFRAALRKLLKRNGYLNAAAPNCA